jgi:hypothetical protein
VSEVTRADVELLVTKAKTYVTRRDEAWAQLAAIDAINEDDWENSPAASWVTRIRTGETLGSLVCDGMVTQEAFEDAFFQKETE